MVRHQDGEDETAPEQPVARQLGPANRIDESKDSDHDDDRVSIRSTQGAAREKQGRDDGQTAGRCRILFAAEQAHGKQGAPTTEDSHQGGFEPSHRPEDHAWARRIQSRSNPGNQHRATTTKVPRKRPGDDDTQLPEQARHRLDPVQRIDPEPVRRHGQNDPQEVGVALEAVTVVEHQAVTKGQVAGIAHRNKGVVFDVTQIVPLPPPE